MLRAVYLSLNGEASEQMCYVGIRVTLFPS